MTVQAIEMEIIEDQRVRQRALERIKAKVAEALENLSETNTDYEQSAKSLARQIVRQELRDFTTAVPQLNYAELVGYVSNDLFGLGCLEPLLKDKKVTDIMVEDTDVYVIAGNERRRNQTGFTDIAELRRVIDRITSRSGKRIDAVTPFCDCHLYEGSRCHIVIPPASDRYYLTIRKLGCMNLVLDDWLHEGVLDANGVDVLVEAINKRKNILISGGTGAGKTTLLNTLTKSIDNDQVIVTMEDTYELNIDKPRARRLLTRPNGVSGVGQIDYRTLLKNALRMNPDRLILGEVRDQAAYELLHSLNIGHRGSLSTIHANSAYDALWRLESLALAAATNMPLVAIKKQVARVIDIVVQIRGIELANGKYTGRLVTEIVRVENALNEKEDYVLTFLYRGIGELCDSRSAI